MITDYSKYQITAALRLYTANYSSLMRASKSLNGVSSAVISQIFNNHWAKISDHMWSNIAGQVGYSTDGWGLVETKMYKMITAFLSDSAKNSLVFALVAPAGSGKTYSINHYARRHKNAILIGCNEFWNKKEFMSEVLRQMGLDSSGMKIGEMVDKAVNDLKTMHDPIIILDEADKLNEVVMYLFITLYNRLDGHCGMVMVATNHLEKRLRRGVEINKRGYQEIWSRLGRKCVDLRGCTSEDICAICESNGITEADTVRDIIRDSESDLRRVKRRIHAELSKKDTTEK